MTTHPTLPAIGTRATVAPVPSVCDYLHGHAGTITEHRWSPTAGRNGAPVAVLRFDTPVPRHWSPTMPLENIALRAEQITPEPV